MSNPQVPPLRNPTAPPAQPTQPLRLVNQWETHLRFAGREPRTLAELATARADAEHKQRLGQIKLLSAKFAQLDTFLPALAERGIHLAQRTVTTLDRGKTLRIQTSTFTHCDNKLHAALIELGFRETERKDWGVRGRGEYLVTLKHGRSLALQIDVMVDAPAAVPATPSNAVPA